jgi:CheY-like chemotaxis protein
MIEKEFLSTGEVAEILNISRDTVIRKFDKGIFTGKKNPITGKRYISRESLQALMMQYELPLNGLALEKRKVLLVTADRGLISLLQGTFSTDKRIMLKTAEFGCDALIMCARESPDALIIDENLPDIPSTEVIKSFRRSEEHRALKIICLSDTCNKILLECGADECLEKDRIERLREESLAVKAYSLLDLAEKRPSVAQAFGHKRRWPRKEIDLPASINFYPLKGPRQHNPGIARVKNISQGGAFVSRIYLERGIIPGEAFRAFLKIDHQPLSHWMARSKVVRLQANGFLEAGVQFVKISKQNLEKIAKVFK